MKVRELNESKLRACVREFNYFLRFLRINEELDLEIAKSVINNEFYELTRLYKMLFLIGKLFYDPLMISYIYLKLYLNKTNYEIKQILKLNDKQLKELQRRLLKRKYEIRLKI